MTIDSALNIGLPAVPLTDNKELAGELQIIYNALHIIQQAMTDGGIVGGLIPTTSISWSVTVSGGALNAYSAGANGLSAGADMAALHALVVAMRATLVANGLMS